MTTIENQFNYLNKQFDNPTELEKIDFSQAKGLQFLLDQTSRLNLRTFIFFVYFIIFQVLLLTQKPFLQFEFAINFYASFAFVFIHHFVLHYFKLENISTKRSIYSYAYDFLIMIVFMQSFPQLSSFLLVLQLFILFIASFELPFISLCLLGFLASVGTSIMNLSVHQAGSTQSLLSLTLFNLSYLSVIVISGQLKEEIFNLQTHLVKTQKKWKSQAEFSKTLLQKMPLGLILSQENQNILLKNTYITEEIKWTDEQAINVIHQFKVSQKDKVYSDIEFLDSVSKQKRIYQIDKTQYFDEDIDENLNLMLIKDVTEVRNLEFQLQQKEKLAAVGQLAAGIAHEIRNPLAGISGSIQMLTEDNLDPDQMKLMRIVLKEIDRLNHLITEFLDYAKPEKKPDQIVDLKFLLEEIILSLKAHKEVAENLKWVVQLQSEKIYGFSEKLRQCFLNIIINAIQALKEQKLPEICIQLTHDENDAIVSIKDNGLGMSEQTKQKMFEPFHTTKIKGTGLGLAITHKILESHSAAITVNSEINIGTEFIIKFPLIGS